MSLRILVVEDYAPFRRITCAALRRRAEFEIFEAADGLTALQRIEELQPDVVLLDINLPELDGFQIAARTGTLAPHARVLFMSQESSSDIVRKALSLGARGYIQKVSAATDLLPAIDAVLAGQRFVSQSVAFPEPIDAAAPRRHEILFCSDDAAVVDGLARCIAAALNAADGAIVVVTESLKTLLLERLRALGVDVDGAIARRTYLSLNADEAPDDRFLEAAGAVREAAARAGKAHPRVSLCGERAGRLWAAGRTAEAIQLEQFCCELAQDFDILCAYPVPHTKDDRELARICAKHSAVRYDAT